LTSLAITTEVVIPSKARNHASPFGSARTPQPPHADSILWASKPAPRTLASTSTLHSFAYLRDSPENLETGNTEISCYVHQQANQALIKIYVRLVILPNLFSCQISSSSTSVDYPLQQVWVLLNPESCKLQLANGRHWRVSAPPQKKESKHWSPGAACRLSPARRPPPVSGLRSTSDPKVESYPFPSITTSNSRPSFIARNASTTMLTPTRKSPPMVSVSEENCYRGPDLTLSLRGQSTPFVPD